MIQNLFPHFEAELAKIASTRTRVLEALIGGGSGAVVGAAIGHQGKDDHSIEGELAGAGAGAAIGAGAGLGLSQFVQALRARAMLRRELPAALAKGKGVIEPLHANMKAAKDDLQKAERMAAAWQDAESHTEALDAESRLQAAKDALDRAKLEHGEDVVKAKAKEKAHSAFTDKLFGLL